MNATLLTVAITMEQDVVLARQRARQIAALVGLDRPDQTRVATAVSEIARNAFNYAGAGSVCFELQDDRGRSDLVVIVSDEGPGIADVDAVMSGSYRSSTGLGLGMSGSARLVDRFAVDSRSGVGTIVTMAKALPAPLTSLAALTAAIARTRPESAFAEVREQNRELLTALDQLRLRTEQAERLNQELELTNLRIVQLHAELAARADELVAAAEARTRLFHSVSHELRTPVNAISALSALLAHDAQLRDEARRQASLINRSATDLTALVNDLLDLARADAGRADLRPGPVDIRCLLTTIRGTFEAQAIRPGVDFVVVEPDVPVVIESDEARLTQILRNLVSNALKFTFAGEVRVSTTLAADGGSIAFRVADTGVGIAAADQNRVFDEFVQVAGPHQVGQKGTGLGLAVSMRLAKALGGRIELASEGGRGSVFTLELPIPRPIEAARFARAVVVDDDEAFLNAARATIGRFVPVVVVADGYLSGEAAIRDTRPDLVLVDLHMPDGEGDRLLCELADAGLLGGAVAYLCSSDTPEPARLEPLARRGIGFVSKAGLDMGALATTRVQSGASA